MSQLSKWTTWPNSGQPAASVFLTGHNDLKVIKSYGEQYDEDIKHLIAVRHSGCRGEIRYDPNEQDPIMSEYVCCGYGDDGLYCTQSWPLTAIQAMDEIALRSHFYTELIENADDLGEWPIKLCEVTNGAIRYSTTRPLTKAELLASRARRILEIREKAR